MEFRAGAAGLQVSCSLGRGNNTPLASRFPRHSSPRAPTAPAPHSKHFTRSVHPHKLESTRFRTRPEKSPQPKVPTGYSRPQVMSEVLERKLHRVSTKKGQTRHSMRNYEQMGSHARRRSVHRHKRSPGKISSTASPETVKSLSCLPKASHRLC